MLRAHEPSYLIIRQLDAFKFSNARSVKKFECSEMARFVQNLESSEHSNLRNLRGFKTWEHRPGNVLNAKKIADESKLFQSFSIQTFERYERSQFCLLGALTDLKAIADESSNAKLWENVQFLKVLKTSLMNGITKHKTNHPISSNSHPSATANKAIHFLKWGGEGNNWNILKFWRSMERCTRLTLRKIIPQQYKEHYFKLFFVLHWSSKKNWFALLNNTTCNIATDFPTVFF